MWWSFFLAGAHPTPLLRLCAGFCLQTLVLHLLLLLFLPLLLLFVLLLPVVLVLLLPSGPPPTWSIFHLGHSRSCQSSTNPLPFFYLATAKTAQSRSLPFGCLQCGHGLTTRPFENGNEGVLDATLALFGYLVVPSRSIKLVR